MLKMRKQKTLWLVCLLALALIVSSTVSYAAQLSIQVSSVACVSSEDESQNGIVVKFDLPSSLENSTIDLAEMYFVISSESADSSAFDLIAHPVQTEWNPQYVTWSEMADRLNDSLVTSGGTDNDAEQQSRLNLTHILQGWIDGDFTNHGVMIMSMPDASRPICFESYPGAQPSVKAVVKIYYTAVKKGS
jgi:hypothetical protein